MPERTIEELLAAMLRGELRSVDLVQRALARIARWDRGASGLHAVLAVNPDAQRHAEECDAFLASENRLRGALHGIPVAVKDNCNTRDMPTTGGSLSLQGAVPPTESTVTRKLREAGAIILAKTNLHEFALAGTTVSSLGGQTRNPYDPARTPGGSSGGSGVAVAMDFATVAIGTDTVNSIRSPASANGLVGLRPTRGLISRAGIMPVSPTQDSVGPIARTVGDVARVLDVLAGYDRQDPVTARCIGRMPGSYSSGLGGHAFQGRRLGVLTALQGRAERHAEVNQVLELALDLMRRAGASVVHIEDPFIDADVWLRDLDVQRWEFRRSFDSWLQKLRGAPVRSLDEILATGRYHQETLRDFLTQAAAVRHPEDEMEYLRRLAALEGLGDRLLGHMAEHRLDAFVYPLQKCLPVRIGEGGQIDRNGIVAALTGFPALNVPMGFSPATSSAPLGVPIGLDFLGRPFDEPMLLGLGCAFEKLNPVRRPPSQA